MKTRTEAKCSRCRRTLNQGEIYWQQWNARRTRLLTYCEHPCLFAKRTPRRERIWSGLFKGTVRRTAEAQSVDRPLIDPLPATTAPPAGFGTSGAHAPLSDGIAEVLSRSGRVKNKLRRLVWRRYIPNLRLNFFDDLLKVSNRPNQSLGKFSA